MHRGLRRLRRLSLAITIIDQHRFATRIVAGIDVAPAIANYKTSREIDIVLALSLEQKPRLRFAASTVVRIVMIADENGIDRQR